MMQYTNWNVFIPQSYCSFMSKIAKYWISFFYMAVRCAAYTKRYVEISIEQKLLFVIMLAYISKCIYPTATLYQNRHVLYH